MTFDSNPLGEECVESGGDTDLKFGRVLCYLEQAQQDHDLESLVGVLKDCPSLRDEVLHHLANEAYLDPSRWPSADLLQLIADKELSSKYELREQGGEGSWGLVVKAWEPCMGRFVAIKMFKLDIANTDAVQRFEREALLLGLLEHQGTVPIYARGCLSGGQPYFVMRWVDGKALHNSLRIKPVRAELVGYLAIFQKICETVAYAHAKALCHRDLKPANVMLGEPGEVYVIDWGLAKIGVGVDPWQGSVTGPTEPGFTQAGARVGSLCYMSPEQATQGKAVTEKCDVFGLGAILCEILTGRPPYSHETVAELIKTASWASDKRDTQSDNFERAIDQALRRFVETGDVHQAGAIARLDTSGTDRSLIDLVKDCLKFHPNDRPTASEVSGRIANYLKGLETDKALLRSSLRWGVVLAIVLILLVGSVGVGLWQNAEHRRKEENQQAEQRLAKSKANAHIFERNLAINDDLTRLEGDLRADNLLAAENTLERLAGRINEVGVEATSQARYQQGRKAIAFIKRHEETRQKSPWRGKGGQFTSNAPVEYDKAFRAAEINLDNPDAADKIMASPIRSQYLAAIDHWALHLPQIGDGNRIKLLRLGKEASPTEWGKQFRNSDLRDNPKELAQFAEQTQPHKCSAAEIECLARALIRTGGDAEPILRRGLALHENDFWLNMLLCLVLEAKAQREQRAEAKRSQYEEAATYARVAVVRNPSAFAREQLGRLLLDCGRLDAAIEQLDRATDEPGATTARQTLVRVLIRKGNLPRAERECAAALRIDPKDKSLLDLQAEIHRAQKGQR